MSILFPGKLYQARQKMYPAAINHLWPPDLSVGQTCNFIKKPLGASDLFLCVESEKIKKSYFSGYSYSYWKILYDEQILGLYFHEKLDETDEKGWRNFISVYMTRIVLSP